MKRIRIDLEQIAAYLNLASWRIIDSYQTRPGKGVPIGALTSQHFANDYLDGLDRFIQEKLPARALVRYMDDSIWWCDDKATAKQTLQQVRAYLSVERLLSIKTDHQINRSSHGVSFCGYRILPGEIRLSQRKQRRYRQRRLAWEAAYRIGAIDALELQQAYAAVHTITDHAQSREWRKNNLQRHPSMEV